MSEQKQQSFLHGTALLALATAIVKVIGAVYSIPLKAIIGDISFGYYSTAYEIYTVLLMISTAGLPVAMSRMISQASTLGNYNQVRKIYQTAKTIFLALGIAGSLLMIFLCRFLAESVMRQPDAWAAIACLGPCCFLICLMSAYRGFFQGQGNMLPTSVSQVLEAVVKLIVGIGLAVVVLEATQKLSLTAGAAILGVTVSCVVSSIYLFAVFRKSYRKLPATQDAPEAFGPTAKRLLAIAVPITIGSAGLSLLNACEIGIYMGQLLEYMPQELADTQKGIYNFVQKIYNMPCAFITPITISILPAITAQLTAGKPLTAKNTAESAARITALICMPCAAGLAVLSQPVTALLGGYTGDNLMLAGNLMTVMGICIVFNATVLLTNTMMQAHGHVNLPVINMFIGGIIKLAAVWLLTGNKHIGILGTPIGSLLCYSVITVLNLITMRRVIPDTPAVVKNMLRALLAAAGMGIVVLAGLQLLRYAGITSRLVLCGVPIMLGVAVYGVLAIALRAITRADCLLLPKGEKIAKLLHLK